MISERQEELEVEQETWKTNLPLWRGRLWYSLQGQLDIW